jgi:hypothetical protein
MIRRTTMLGLVLLLTLVSNTNAGIVFDDFSTFYGSNSDLGGGFIGATGVVSPSGAQMTRSEISNSGGASFYQFTLPEAERVGAPTPDNSFIQYMFENPMDSNLEFFTLPVNLLSGTLNMKVSTLDQSGTVLNTLYDGQVAQSVSGLVGAEAYGVRIVFAQAGRSEAMISVGSGGSFAATVPEPTSYLMLGSLIGLGFVRRRRSA